MSPLAMASAAAARISAWISGGSPPSWLSSSPFWRAGAYGARSHFSSPVYIASIGISAGMFPAAIASCDVHARSPSRIMSAYSSPTSRSPPRAGSNQW